MDLFAPFLSLSNAISDEDGGPVDADDFGRMSYLCTIV